MKMLQSLQLVLSRRLYLSAIIFKDQQKSSPEPPPLNLCCMSGCANCVWLKYTEELIAFYKSSDEGVEKALEAIERDIEDINLKSYLKMEIKFLKK